ncbi:ATP-binding cassette domain-containing protein [Aerococcus agrisoli]|uniref:Quaternary amine transport ATP-binding protein n=1 Tax=Aerococcus agrisoli TaxID=2487350 RepID=A0A3N4GIM6_9LACT|nr:ABC transporter ATP-binding protein [Aerococcus agrisoli]RPA60416.1 ATP-binding cassette domain-containing protein [Aerococcus agrisoli]
MIEFKHVEKVYPGGTTAVKDATLTIEDGEFVCFIGTSGSGKTTALRMINRMHDPSSGEILIDGQATTSIDPVKLRRGIGYVIQQTGLMPHLTVYDNIVTVPRLLKWDEKKNREIAERLMKRVELPLEYLDRYPSELSGGQQQRIGVIRALAANPKIVLMDEPFGALDPITREALQELVKELQVEFGSTFVFVTHDMDEALNLSDKIAVWHEGELIQYDTPDEILRNPANEHVRGFLGEDRLLQAQTEFITVKEIMITQPLTATMGMSLARAISVMRKNRVDSLFVVDDDHRLKGLLTLNDVASRSAHSNLSVADVMHTNLRPVLEDALVQDTATRILKGRIPNMPVVDKEGHLTGLVTRTALVNLVYNSIWGDEEEIDNLTDEPVINPTPVNTSATTEGAEK